MAAVESLYKNLTFLIVDDFPAMCKQIERILLSVGVDAVDIVYNGEKALLACSKQKYDVIFADFNLGAGKNGQQLLEELRHRKLIKPECAYIMITAEATKDFVFGALEFAPDTYLNKPFNQAELLQRLQRIVQEKRAIGPVMVAAEKGELQQAIALCIKGIQTDPKRRTQYLKMLGEFYLQTQSFDKAISIYDQVLSVRALDWALLGKARCHLCLDELEEASDVVTPMIAKNTPHMEAYDIAASIAAKRGNNQAVQAVLEHAVSVSPRSVKRQKQLAGVAEENNDFLTSESAHKKAMKSAEFSMHEGPNMYLDYANSVNKVMQTEGVDAASRFKESQRILGKVKQKYRDPLVSMRVDMAASHANRIQGNQKEADTLLQKVVTDYSLLEGQMGASMGPESRLEFAGLLVASGEQEKAQDILKALANDYPQDHELGKKIDRISSEPLSQNGKAAAVKLNREGKVLLQDKHFAKAIELFDRALSMYPNNIGLKLNLVLASIQLMRESGVDSDITKRCKDLLDSVGDLAESNEFYSLKQTLRRSL